MKPTITGAIVTGMINNARTMLTYFKRADKAKAMTNPSDSSISKPPNEMINVFRSEAKKGVYEKTFLKLSNPMY